MFERHIEPNTTTTISSGMTPDPEDPTCARLTFSGTFRKTNATETTVAKAALFARHPQMAHWPASHGFTVYELVVTDIWMIDFYGGGAGVTPQLFSNLPKPRATFRIYREIGVAMNE